MVLLAWSSRIEGWSEQGTHTQHIPVTAAAGSAVRLQHQHGALPVQEEPQAVLLPLVDPLRQHELRQGVRGPLAPRDRRGVLVPHRASSVDIKLGQQHVSADGGCLRPAPRAGKGEGQGLLGWLRRRLLLPLGSRRGGA